MAETKRMTAAQAVVESMIQHGVRYVFGIFGHGNVQLGEALAERTKEITFVQVKNEQAAVHMAIGYYRQCGKISAVTTSIGPGATNMVTGALVAKIGRFPVLLLPGEAFAHRDPRGPVLQEIEGPKTANDTLAPVSGFFHRLRNAEEAPEVMRTAFNRMQMPGYEAPAVIALPMDVQAEAGDFRPAEFRKKSAHDQSLPDDDVIEQAAEALLASKRPLIIAGGGVLRSWQGPQQLDALSRKLKIPVVHTQGGMGALLADHPYNLFSAGPTGTWLGNNYAERADVVLAVGTRLDDFTTASETLFSDEAEFITLNVNSDDLRKADAGIRIRADAGLGLMLLREAVGDRNRLIKDSKESVEFIVSLANGRGAWLDEADYYRNLPPNDAGLLPQSSVLGIINDTLAHDAVIVAAAGSLPGDLLTLWRCRDETGKGYHLEYDASTMGYEIPGAIGVKLAAPSRHVVALLGDGSFLMNPTEILTAVQERLAVTFVIIDSRGHRSIQGCQEGNALQKFGTEYRMRNPESGLLNGNHLPFDLAAMARGLGAEVLTPKTPETIRKALRLASRADHPVVIVIPVDTERTVPNFAFWDVPIPSVSERPELQEKRAEYEQELTRRRNR